MFRVRRDLPRSRANSVLTEEAIGRVFEMYFVEGMTQYEIAEYYGMDRMSIWNVLRGRTYRGVSVPLMCRYGVG